MAGKLATAASTVVGMGAQAAATATTTLSSAETVTAMGVLAAEQRTVQMASATIEALNTLTKAMKDHIKKGAEAATTNG